MVDLGGTGTPGLLHSVGALTDSSGMVCGWNLDFTEGWGGGTSTMLPSLTAVLSKVFWARGFVKDWGEYLGKQKTDKSVCYGLNVCVPIKFSVEILTLEMLNCCFSALCHVREQLSTEHTRDSGQTWSLLML